jgi:spore coat protein U-like protein
VNLNIFLGAAMKTNRIVLKAIAAALFTASGVASAADSQSLAVSATVSGVCKFTTPARTMNFTVDPSSASNIAGVMTGAVEYKCTKDTAATGVTAGNGNNFSAPNRRMSDGGATPVFLPYSLTVAGGTQMGTGFGAGQQKTLTVTGSVAVADFENLPAGTYTDSVTLTLAP